MGISLNPKFETASPNEAVGIQSIIDATIAKQEKTHKKGTLAKRDVHSKSHGTVRAQFRVLADIPAALKVGLFATPASYDADVRFSNGAPLPDIFPNVRGIAIKLYNVPGAKLLHGSENSTEHDFLLANDRTFFVDQLKYMVMMARGQMGQIAKEHPVILKYIAGAMLKFVKNPLNIDYFSQVPYLCGDNAAHYALIAQEKAPFFSLPNPFDADYMLHGIEKRLKQSPVKMTFCVQLQQPGESVEDSSKLWRGKLVPVAELTFLQTDKPLRESDGEALSFNPWHVLKEHQPLGWPGRVRRDVYLADFNWRKKVNAEV
jgi:hypothetical protein